MIQDPTYCYPNIGPPLHRLIFCCFEGSESGIWWGTAEQKFLAPLTIIHKSQLQGEAPQCELGFFKGPKFLRKSCKMIRGLFYTAYLGLRPSRSKKLRGLFDLRVDPSQL